MGLIKHLWEAIAGVPPKFEYTNECIQFQGETLRRIRALRRMEIEIEGRRAIINPGDLGGFLAYNSNRPDDCEFHLSHRDNSWIGGNAKCCGLSQVTGDSLLTGNAVLSGTVKLYKSFVGGRAYLGGNAKAYYSCIFGDARVDNANISNSYIFDNVSIDGAADIGTCCIYDNAKITVSGEFASIQTIKVTYARVFGNTDIRYPIENSSCNYGMGIYEKKSVRAGRIDSRESFAAAQRSGNICDLGRDCCVINSPYGYEQIDKVLPLKRPLDIPFQK